MRCLFCSTSLASDNAAHVSLLNHNDNFVGKKINDEKKKKSAHAAGSAGASHDAVAATPWSSAPQCDICRCAPAMLLCTDDRAVMCRG